MDDDKSLAQLLQERLDSDQLEGWRVRWAARLGHPAARLILPSEESADGADVIGLLSSTGQRLLAVDYARRALPLYEAAAPGDERPARALAQAEAWARSGQPKPPPDHLNCMADAFSAASEVERQRTPAANAATWAARCAGHCLTHESIDAATWSGSEALMAAVTAGRNRKEVEEWQRKRLADYILREGL